MRKITLMLAAVLALPSFSFATPSSSILGMKATESSLGSRKCVLINITNTLDEAPTERCDTTLYGSLTTVGTTAVKKARRLVTKRSVRQVTRFRYKGSAVVGTSSKRTQLNLIARTTCPGSNVTFDSNIDASVVTCKRGVTRNRFFQLLQNNLR